MANDAHRPRKGVMGRKRNRVSIHRRIRKTQKERGDHAEQQAHKALCVLRNQWRVPIIITVAERGDHRDRKGVDFEIKGKGSLYARFGIDVKSSTTGVEEYLAKQEDLRSKGVRDPFPRYPFLFHHQSDLCAELFQFILEKSESHQDAAKEVAAIRKRGGPHVGRELQEYARALFVT